jgi:ketosteroid isomerase-like protein
VSKQNVELVRSLIPGDDVDVVALLRDFAARGESRQLLGSLLAPDLECVGRYRGELQRHHGPDGLIAMWSDWLEPWTSYRTHIDELIDLGDRVLALVRDYGRRADLDVEVEAVGGAIWTVRDGKVSRIEFFPDRAQALEAAGLEQR